MRRIPLVVLLLLALAATVWVLRPAPDEETGAAAPLPSAGAPPPGPGAMRDLPPGEARLEGRPDARKPTPLSRALARLRDAATRPSPPAVVLRGTVRDEHGAPVYDAVVYQLPANAARGTGWVRAQARTGTDGTFSLGCEALGGTWIAVRSPGRRTVFLEGGAIRPGQALDLVLEEPPPLVVRVVDAAGEPVWGASIRAIPVTGGGSESAFPGPESPVAERYEMTDGHGVAVFHFPAAVPVVVLCEVEGLLAHPTEQRAEEGAGTFDFVMLAAGGIAVKAVDEAGEPIREHLHVCVLDPDTGEELCVYQGSEADGALEAEPPLPPGPYPVEVTARGHEPALIPALELPVSPGVVERTVTMGRLGEPARLRLVLPDAPEANAPWNLLLRRLEPGWIELGWRLRRDHRTLPEEGALEVDLRPGTWEAFVARSGTDAVAVLGPVTLAPGETIVRRLKETAGTSFPLYAALPADLRVRGLRVQVPGFGLVPPFGFWTGLRTQEVGGILATIAPPGSALRRDERGGAVLGPYPGTLVVLEVDDWGGTTHRFRVSR